MIKVGDIVLWTWNVKWLRASRAEVVAAEVGGRWPYTIKLEDGRLMPVVETEITPLDPLELLGEVK